MKFDHMTFYASNTMVSGKTTTISVTREFHRAYLSTPTHNVEWIKAKKYNDFTFGLGLALISMSIAIPVAAVLTNSRYTWRDAALQSVALPGLYLVWDYVRPMPVVYSSTR